MRTGLLTLARVALGALILGACTDADPTPDPGPGDGAPTAGVPLSPPQLILAPTEKGWTGEVRAENTAGDPVAAIEVRDGGGRVLGRVENRRLLVFEVGRKLPALLRTHVQWRSGREHRTETRP